MLRDFTYIDDIVEGVVRALDKPATASSDYDELHPIRQPVMCRGASSILAITSQLSCLNTLA